MVVVVVVVLLLVVLVVVVVVIVVAASGGSILFPGAIPLAAGRGRRILLFFAPRKPKTTVFTVFLCPCLAKTLVFTQFSPCCKMRKGQTHCILQCFCFPSAAEKSSKKSSKTVQNRFPQESYNFSIFLPGPEPPKT